MSPSGVVYVLDAQYGIYGFRFYANGDWELVETINNPVSKAFAFDVNTLMFADGTTRRNIVVLGQKYFVLLENEQTSRVYDIPFVVDYPANITLS